MLLFAEPRCFRHLRPEHGRPSCGGTPAHHPNVDNILLVIRDAAIIFLFIRAALRQALTRQLPVNQQWLDRKDARTVSLRHRWRVGLLNSNR